MCSNTLVLYTIDMGIFSNFKHKETGNAGGLKVAVTAPDVVSSREELLTVGVTLTAGSEQLNIAQVALELTEHYDRHTEDYQATADKFHEVKATLQHVEKFSLKPDESKTIELKLRITPTVFTTDNIVQDNTTNNGSITRILRTGPVISNVLRLGDNKENIHYNLTTTVEANGKLVSPPALRILIK